VTSLTATTAPALRLRLPGTLHTLVAMTLCAGLLSACGSTGPPQASSAVRSTCERVSAVLSDGPDPGADPVGYAQAQVLPLRQIHTSDTNLKGAINDLASAYEQFSLTSGTKATKRAVTRASDKVDAICPGAAS
jgi:hypothetical protein